MTYGRFIKHSGGKPAKSNKKWTWAGHVMRRLDNRGTTRVTEWQPRNGKRNQGRQRVRWRNEIRAFSGPSKTERGGECWERPLSCSGLAMDEYDDDDDDEDSRVGVHVSSVIMSKWTKYNKKSYNKEWEKESGLKELMYLSMCSR